MDKFDRKFKGDRAATLLAEVKDARAMIVEQYGKRWSDLRDAYEMGLERSEGDEQGLHLGSSMVDSFLAFVAYQNGRWFSQPTQPGESEAERAAVRGAALDAEWRDGRLWRVPRKAAQDALILGIGYCRISATGTDDFVSPESYSEEPDDLLAEATGEDSPDRHPCVEYIAPENVVFYPGYDELDKMPFVAFRHLMLVDAVRANPQFAGARKIEPNAHVVTDAKAADDMTIFDMQMGKLTQRHVEIWEVWYQEWVTARVGGKMRRFKECRAAWITDAGVEGGNKTDGPMVLRHRVSFLDHPGYPVVSLTFLPTNGRLVGASPLERVLPILRDMQRTWDRSVDGTMRAFNEKLLYNEGSLSITAKAALGTDRSEVIPVKSRNVAAAFTKIAATPFPPQFMQWFGLARTLFSEAGGGSEEMRGGRSPTAVSATQTSARVAAEQTKIGDMLARYEEMLTELGKRTLALMQQYTDRARYARVGDTGEMKQYDSESLAGMADIVLYPGSTRPQTREQAQQALMGFVGATAGVVSQLQTVGAPPALIETFLGQMMRLWEQSGPEMRDGFAGLVSQTMQAAGAAPTSPPGGPPVGSENGVAEDPTTGESLNAPNPGDVN